MASLKQLLDIIGNPLSSNLDIKKASKILTHECFKHSTSIPGLLEIAVQDENSAIRQLAAVEVRKLIQKEEGQMWEALDECIRESIKNSILSISANEKSSLIRHSFAHVIAVIAKNELRYGRWGNLIDVLYQACSSTDVIHRDIGIYVLYSLFEVISDQMEAYIPQLMDLFSGLILDESLNVGVTTVQALGKISEFIDEQNLNAIGVFQNLVPAIVQVLQNCLQKGDDEGVSKIFEVFNDMLLLEAPLLSKHFVDLIKLFLSISESQDNNEDIRVQSLSFLMWCIMSAKSKILKSRLITPILSTMFAIAAEEEPENRDEDYPAKLAIQVINTLSTTFAPQQVFPEASQLAVARLQSLNPGDRKASMLAIAVLVEGCADYMRPHLKSVLEMVLSGMKDPDTSVQRAACMALGSLCDDFEDEVSAEHATLLPILFSLISNDSQPLIHSEALSTLDVLIENLGSEIIPYMDGILTRLFVLWEHGTRKAQITTTNCIGSVAFASNSEFLPYFEKTMSRLFVLMSISDPLDLPLRSVATDCVGAVATAVGKEVFMPFLGSVMQTVIQGMNLDNSQLNQCSYVLCGVLGRLFEAHFTQYLQVIVPPILQSCLNEEKEFSSRDVEVGEDEDDRPIFASGIAQEKESSVDTLGELFASTKSSFMEFVPDSMNTALELLDHYHESVRISAAGCLLKFFNTAYGMTNSVEWVPGLPLQSPLHENVANIGKLAIEGVLLLLSDEDDRMVVTQCLTFFSECLKCVGPAAFCQQFSGENSVATGSHLDMLANQLLLILRGDHSCQSIDAMDDENAGEDLAELDALVISAAADCVGAMSAALGPQFAPYFQSFFPLIAKFYKKTKPLADRSMAIGAIAEAVDGLESGSSPFTNDLMNLFLKALRDEEEEVRSNAAYGAGVLVLHSELVAETLAFYPKLLQLLHPLFTDESGISNVKDNACGALCRMVLKSAESVPLDHAIPLILDCLPLKNDFEENRPVFKTLVMLLNAGNPLMLKEIGRVISIFAAVLGAPGPAQVDDSTKALVKEFVRENKDVLSHLPPDVHQIFF